MDDLKAKLAIQETELKQKNENADKLIQVVGVETEKVSKEKAIADEEEVKVEVINKVPDKHGFGRAVHAAPEHPASPTAPEGREGSQAGPLEGRHLPVQGSQLRGGLSF